MSEVDVVTASEDEVLLKVAAPKTVTVPVDCELFGDNDKVIQRLKLKVTFEKTDKDTWDKEADEADASMEEPGAQIMVRKKVKNITGLPLEDSNGNPLPFNEKAMDEVVKIDWIFDPIWMTLQSVNKGMKSNALQKALKRNL